LEEEEGEDQIVQQIALLCFNIIKYPKYDEKLTIDDEVGIALQVCGKLRAVIKVKKDLSKAEIEKLAFDNENVQKFIAGKEIKKTIIVPNKLVNIVAI